MVRLADAGNTDAGRRLIEFASRLMRGDQVMPNALRDWLAERLASVALEPKRASELLRVASSAARPPDLAGDMHARQDLEAFQDRVAWAAFHAIATKQGPTKPNARGDATAFEIVARWAGCSADQARRWHGERLKAMRAHQVRIAKILSELEELPDPAK